MLKEGQVRIPSGCAIAAVISREGNKMTGEKIIGCMRTMHDRNNGLGGGFAAYGIYPEYKEQYALHLFYDSIRAREETERFLKDSFEVVRSENIPTRKIPEITDEPMIWRYFVSPLASVLAARQLDEKEYVVRIVTYINTIIKGAFVFSRNTPDTPGPRTADTQRTPPAGGAARTRSRFWITPSCITARYPPTTRTADS